jgi:apolipoprotein D and lipocalin family protein
VVSIPNRKYLWIVSRTARLRQDLLDAALASAAQQGHDLAQLRSTARASISGQ